MGKGEGGGQLWRPLPSRRVPLPHSSPMPGPRAPACGLGRWFGSLNLLTAPFSASAESRLHTQGVSSYPGEVCSAHSLRTGGDFKDAKRKKPQEWISSNRPEWESKYLWMWWEGFPWTADTQPWLFLCPNLLSMCAGGGGDSGERSGHHECSHFREDVTRWRETAAVCLESCDFLGLPRTLPKNSPFSDFPSSVLPSKQLDEAGGRQRGSQRGNPPPL